MVAQHLPQSPLQQMRGTVVFTSIHTVCPVYFKRRPFPCAHPAAYYFSDMPDPAAGKLYGIRYFKRPCCSAYHAAVPVLAAHGSIKRRFPHNNRSVFSCIQINFTFCLGGQGGYAFLCSQRFITHKFTADTAVQPVKQTCIRIQSCRKILIVPGFLLLFFHGGSKTTLIHLQSLFLCQLHCQFQGKTKRIIEIKCRFSVDRL